MYMYMQICTFCNFCIAYTFILLPILVLKEEVVHLMKLRSEWTGRAESAYERVGEVARMADMNIQTLQTKPKEPWEKPQDKHSKETQNSYRPKSLALFFCKIQSQSSITSPHSREKRTRIFRFWSSFFFFLLFFLSLTHNSKSVQRIRTVCTPNNCTTIRDLPFLG